MKRKNKQYGLTLVETAVVLAGIAILAVLSVPAINAFFDSLGSAGGTRAAISASLASARAIAAKEQRYAGVRFQEDLAGNQYMIFIMHDVNSFRAVEGLKPIKLPENIGVMDLRLGADSDRNVAADADILIDWQVRDTTTFSIVFSPAGKLVIHDVQVRNRDGFNGTNNGSYDDVFNTRTNVETNGIGMFVQDDYSALGLVKEPGRNSFVIYDRREFGKVDSNKRWSGYLWKLAKEVIYINPYTGTIISGN